MTVEPPPAPALPGDAGSHGTCGEAALHALLEGQPVPMLQADAHGAVVWMNAAARHSLGTTPQAKTTLADLGMAGLDLDVTGPSPTDLLLQPLQGEAAWHRVSVGPPAAGLRLLTLTPVNDLAHEAARARHLAELLDTVQDFGRLGVWERDVRTLTGRWDRHMYRFWGRDPDTAPPDFTTATLAIVEEDRAGIDSAFYASLRQAGSYSHRYRVRRPDGTVRQLHSHWAVKNDASGQPSRVLGVLMDDTESWELARSHDAALTQLRAAVDLGRIAIWRHDLLTDRMHYSAMAYEVLGMEPRPEGLTLAEVRERIHPDDLRLVVATAERALQTNEPVDFEARYRRSDGQWRTVMTRRVVQRDSDGRPIAFTGVGLDVTEQREESRRARDMVRRFELATRTAGIGYWNQDQTAQRARWSDQMLAIHGLPPGSKVPSVREWLTRFVHPDDREQVRTSLRDWVHSGRPLAELDFRLVRTDGAVIDVISHSRVEGPADSPLLFGIVVDVTERRAAELALRQAGVRAALIAQGVGLGTWEYDLVAGTSFWDEQMWRLRGLEPQAGVMPHDERMAIIHPDDRDAAQRMYERSINSALPIDYEFRVRWPDGSWRWLASRSVAVSDGEGRPVRRIGVNWDTSDARSAVVAREEKAAAQREVQAKSQFLSRMSHELRTPLNAVLGFTQLLVADNERGSGAAMRQRRLAHIASAGQHLLSLIDDVLDLSRLEGGEVTIAIAPTALRPVLEEVLPLLDPLMRQHGVRIVTGAIDVVPMTDPTRLRQVLLNLLTNAVKYNHSGGSVSVEAEARDGVVLIRVADTGRGMSPEQQRHLFEPFNRLGAEGTAIEGTGIGLAIVKALVERMGGTVEVISSSGIGSTFALCLRDGADAPPVPEELASPQAMALAATVGRVGGAGQGGSVLYIEDNPVNAMIVSELLARRTDLTLHTAVDGLSGLAMAQRVRPNLILLDMQLPDIDGHQVFERLQADPATARIPCIALSANAMPSDIDRALRLGFSDYWTKPLDFRAFMASIETLFGPAP